jgi:hypothetical protein
MSEKEYIAKYIKNRGYKKLLKKYWKPTPYQKMIKLMTSRRSLN